MGGDTVMPNKGSKRNSTHLNSSESLNKGANKDISPYMKKTIIIGGAVVTNGEINSKKGSPA